MERHGLLINRHVAPPGQLGRRVSRPPMRERSSSDPVGDDVHRHVMEDAGLLGLLLGRLHGAGAGAVRLRTSDREDVSTLVEEGLNDPRRGLVDVGVRAVGGRPADTGEVIGPGGEGSTDATP
eukprot:3601798-Alexandrium_andersonii.AAC.1